MHYISTQDFTFLVGIYWPKAVLFRLCSV